jgi:putative cardiolipin synthase
MRRTTHLSLQACVLALMTCVIMGCTNLPSLDNRPVSSADLNTAATRLGQAVSARTAAHPGQSGVYPLPGARDAFAARTMLAHSAERTLDVQYYIWRNDMTGTLLFAALRRAAERGVRVRLLLDDNNTSGLDAALAVLDAHAHIEVRLFNPFVIRRVRALGYLTDFPRANRRMHNKSFTAASQVTVVGGRNIGDEYFAAGENVLFADLDVMAIGPVVAEVSKDFDRYWNSDSSYPADRLLRPVDQVAAENLRQSALRLERSQGALAYTSAVRESAFVHDVMKESLPWEWAVTQMVSDDPAKGLGRPGAGTLIFDQLRQAMGEPYAELNLVSPYFVPTRAGVDAFVAMARRGVRIRVLTNALEATDVALVHAGYAKHRRALLEAGVKLYELKGTPPVSANRPDLGLAGSSASSLHSKTMSVDGKRIFIGSFNFDPRSARLNTEMGFVIDSPLLAGQISTAFDQRIPAAAYEVCLSPEGKLYWLERRVTGVVRHDVEPGTSFRQRAGVWLMSLLPIEWLL